MAAIVPPPGALGGPAGPGGPMIETTRETEQPPGGQPPGGPAAPPASLRIDLESGLTLAANRHLTVIGVPNDYTRVTISRATNFAAFSLFTNSLGATLNLNTLTVFGGVNFQNPNGTLFGGGVKNEGELSVADCLFKGNLANRGGAIWSDGTLTILGSTFDQNIADQDGGALALTHTGSTSIYNSHFQGNRTSLPGAPLATGKGGAIALNGSHDLTMLTVDFTDNAGNLGGAIYASLAQPGELWGSGVTFVNNRAETQGGAIYNSTADMTFSGGSSWTGNTAKFDGGAIYNKLGTLAISQSWFGFNNKAQGGVGDLIANDASIAILIDWATTQAFDRPWQDVIVNV